jgi:hypothetical protein
MDAMAQGVDAVKAALVRDFGPIEINEGFDSSSRDTLFSFEFDCLPYKVRVSEEYDTGYASGRSGVDLSTLGSSLKASSSGIAHVMRTGIILK